MSGLKVDINSINNNVIPTLNKSITKLENAAETLRSVSYVEYYTFDSRSKVQNALPRDIRSIKWNISGVKKWLEDASDRFKQAEENTKKLVESLQVPTSNISIITNKSNTEVKELSEGTNSNNYNVFASKESYDEFLKNFCNPDTLSIYKVNYEGNLKLTQTEILEKNRKGTKVKDDPETQEGLELLNNLLNAQKADLKDDVEEIKNKLPNDVNPQLADLINEYLGSFESGEDVDYLIFLLESGKEELDIIIPDSENYNSIYYNSDITIGKSAYEKFVSAGTTNYSEEDWKKMQEYLKNNNLTWKDIKKQYSEAIEELQEYRDELLSAQNAIYQLERYIELYPYTKITQNVDFEEYLEREYSYDENVIDKVLNFLTFGLVEPGKIENSNELTQEEKAIYFYIKEKYSEEEAEEYYKSMEDTINQRKGMKDALKYIESLDVSELDTEAGVEGFLKAIGMGIDANKNFVKTAGTGVYDGIWSFGEGLYNLFPGNGEITSELQYKQAFIISMLTQDINLDEIEKTYGKDSEEYKAYEKLYKMQDVLKEALGFEYNVAVSIGSEAIPIGVNLIPYAGPYLSVALSGLSDAGHAKATAYQSGVTGWNAYLYAGIRGVSSAVITKSFGAVPGVSKNASTTFKGIIKGATEARNFCCCTIKD